ncbi:SAM-dependent methyltransferase [Leptothrix discophora]|uniref:Class I SAM-dependent methyltransferase n=1 Tax=Leptothrix discophora TaxID=89 RepID=A0ABT9G990_LEPDI|nr:class I SAM-dependent methyltransferase [Leptothrix discophora]MDP4302912.1 class I SAM-dependent methyltransferase [Leptothrix discophora]
MTTQTQTQPHSPSRRATDPPPPVRPDLAWRRLLDQATAPYRSAGRFAWHFARGKLGRDPVFRHLLESGLIRSAARILDIGCGQALLAHLVPAAQQAARAGQWPAEWAAAPGLAHYTGVELMPRDVARAQAALTGRHDVQVLCGDMRELAFPACDTVVILDVLHYVDIAAQDAVLARVHQALTPGGVLLLRIGDADRRSGFVASQWVDRLVTWTRGHRVPPTWGRPLRDWLHLLARLGFVAEARPMSQGTPFANVLLVARKPAEDPST